MKNIKLIVLDVDGVLTDGKIIYGPNEDEYKAFHAQDGMGISLARYTGIKFAVITGRKSEALSKRAKELSIDYIYQGIHKKLEVLEKIKAELDIDYEQICYVGDDINDLPIMRKVGFPCAPNNAVPIVQENAVYVASLNGGQGAVREIIDYILSKQEDYTQLIEDYIMGKIRTVQ